MLSVFPSEDPSDTAAEIYASMTEDKVTEILVRLERLDAGQRYVIEQIGSLQSADRQNQSSLDSLAVRVAKVEWQSLESERRAQPWRSLAFSVVAAWVTAIGTYLAIHVLTHG